MIPRHFVGHTVGTISIEGALTVGGGGAAAGEVEGGWAPVGGILIVAGDAGLAGDVLAILPVGREAGGLAAELIAKIHAGVRVEGVGAVDGAAEAEAAGG